MVVTAIISVVTSPPSGSIIETLTTKLESLGIPFSFVIGTKVQDPSTVQITTFWPQVSKPSALASSTPFQALIEQIKSTTSSAVATTIADLNATLDHPLPLTEWVKVDFPASSMSPAFQNKIEADFARFESIFRQRGPAHDLGEGKLSTGWAEEHDGVRSFVVSRGWEGMKWFEEAVETESFKEGAGILMGWGVPFELWHVDTKANGRL